MITDVYLRDMDGFSLCKYIREHKKLNKLPILFVSKNWDRETKVEAFRSGGNDFLGKPFDRLELLLRIKNLLIIKEYMDFLENQQRNLEQKIKEATQKLENAYKDLNEAYIETVHKLTIAAEFRDEDTGAHIKRIGYYAKEVASLLGMDPDFSNKIFYAAPMHDIGKMAIPDSILLKESRLSFKEYTKMKEHTIIGYRLLSDSNSDMLNMGARIALTHHEKYDGTGYPYGLEGEEIPLEGRIVMMVDIYDALRSKRPYKLPFSHKKTMEIILKGDSRTATSNFDPHILSVIKKHSDVLADIFNQFQDE